jgi:hypothetical protein
LVEESPIEMAARQLVLDRLEARRMGSVPKPSTKAV